MTEAFGTKSAASPPGAAARGSDAAALPAAGAASDGGAKLRKFGRSMRAVGHASVAVTRFLRFSRKGAFPGMDTVVQRLVDKSEVDSVARASGACSRTTLGVARTLGRPIGVLGLLSGLTCGALLVVAATSETSGLQGDAAIVVAVLGLAVGIVLAIQGVAVAHFFKGHHMSVLVNTTRGVGEALGGSASEAGLDVGAAPAQGNGTVHAVRNAIYQGLGVGVLVGGCVFAAVLLLLKDDDSGLAIVAAALGAFSSLVGSLASSARGLSTKLLDVQAESLDWFTRKADFGKNQDLALSLREALELSTIAVRTLERSHPAVFTATLGGTLFAAMAAIVTIAVEVTDVTHYVAGYSCLSVAVLVVSAAMIAWPVAATNDRFSHAVATVALRCSASLGATGASTAALLPIRADDSLLGHGRAVAAEDFTPSADPPAAWFTFSHTADVLLGDKKVGLDMLEEGCGAEAMPRVQKEVNKALYLATLGLGDADPAYAVRLLGIKLSRSGVAVSTIFALLLVAVVERLSAVATLA